LCCNKLLEAAVIFRDNYVDIKNFLEAAHEVDREQSYEEDE
jgi:hypothetical protein